MLMTIKRVVSQFVIGTDKLKRLAEFVIIKLIVD